MKQWKKEKSNNLLLHILPTSIGKVLRISGRIMLSSGLLHHPSTQTHWTGPVIPDALDAARLHGLKPNHHRDVHDSTSHQCPGQLQACRAGRASVIGVVDGNIRHAELIEDALAGRGVAVAVARHTGLDIIVGDVCVEQGLGAGLEAQFWVWPKLAWLDELREAHA